ncbi:hypothetical protein RclHR1_03950013 [Rhizophagus clarus]|uniref:F-box domain-containing protein n=1 Tax=Rhizophagus clarus TaxID=94130 RepID=A0A2Z6S8E6_9GLOM|nr:hypothetical protein RclHR1_03950013 [Rhizophagus clarus]GES92868.1 hypothetical protein GLOIN_2v1886013 [Rhizophagus clarus]
MSKLNRDVLYLIFEELNKNEKSLCSYLYVNKTWCEMMIPFLWKNPWKYTYSKNHERRLRKLLVDIIILHLSDEKINKLKSQGFYFSINSYKKPLFDYISYCKHLNLNEIKYTLKIIEMDFILNEIINIFVNQNTTITHLYIPKQFDYQIHLIPGIEYYFSNIEFLSCNANTNDDILNGLAEICKSVKELELIINEKDNNHGIVRLVEFPEKLFNVRFLTNYVNRTHDESFWEVLENSLIKHINTIRHFKIGRQPITQILTHFTNLRSLDITADYYSKGWHGFENVSLPFLQIIRTKGCFVTLLANLIGNTSRDLTEFTIHSGGGDIIGNRLVIQAVYKNCPNLKYFKLPLRNSSILELENLLINCQYLDGLYILTKNSLEWDDLFEILVKSSPKSLYKFIICFYYYKFKLESLKLFFDNWKGRQPMILRLIQITKFGTEHKNLIEKYKSEGVIQEFSYSSDNIDEWTSKFNV